MGETEEFNTLAFEKKLIQLKDTQESIQSLSAWCLKQRTHHKKVVSSWLNVLKRVKIEQRLVLFYLANDVIQYSKRKNYEFVKSWGLSLQKATPLVRDEKVRHKILRIFKIWEQRSVYDEEFLSDLTGLLSAGAGKKSNDDDSLEFQPQQLVNKIRQCSVLEADTDLRLKYIHESHLDLSDADALCANLKDRRHKDDVEKELNEGIACVERYTQALQKEIVAREALLALLTSANQYYSTQRGEVKVVAYAYKNFGGRVRVLKRKLDDLIPQLPNSAPSPPERDEDVPSPGPDEDLDLPLGGDGDDVTYNIDKTFSTSITADGSLYNMGLSSFLGNENALTLFQDNNQTNGNKIEVINNRPSDKQDFSISDFLKNLVPTNETSVSNSSVVTVTPVPVSLDGDQSMFSSVSGPILQKSPEKLPGLDLLTPDSTAVAPPTSFYGSIETGISEEPEPYHTQPNNQWNTNNTWSLPVAPQMVPPVTLPPPPVVPPLVPPVPPPSLMYIDTPESPPPPIVPPVAPPLVPETRLYMQELPPADVDHRGLLPPPPPPPVIPAMGQLEDVDHRLLPSLPPPPPPAVSNRHPSAHKDVDHRNLIPLTHQPAPIMRGMDQDYRVQPPIVPSDIVESVDMDLSEDEEQHAMQQLMFSPHGQNQQHYNQSNFQHDEINRRHYNNKVLVGGNTIITNHKEAKSNPNLIRINSIPNENIPKETVPVTYEKIEKPLTAPAILMNPFGEIPSSDELNYEDLNNREQEESVPEQELEETSNPEYTSADFDNIEEAMRLMDDDRPDDFTRDVGIAGLTQNREIVRNPSPPAPDMIEAEWIRKEREWSNPPPSHNRPNSVQVMNHMNPRFQRNWNPMMRTPNFRPHGFMPQQRWPRNGPRPPNRMPWMGPRPPRFW